MEKAIYFVQEFNPLNPPANATCLIYNSADGLQLISDRKIIDIPIIVDKQQQDIITKLTNKVSGLEKELNIIKTDAASGLLETNTSIIVTDASKIENAEKNIIGDSDKDFTVYNAALKNTTVKTIKGNNIVADGISITADKSNSCLVFKAKDTVNLNDISVSGEFSTNTNQIDVDTAETIKLNDSTFTADGYNGVMIAQIPAGSLANEVIPSSILIENVNFEGSYNLDITNICATKDNTDIIIRNCTFGSCEAPLRFRNSLNATGVNVLVENCHFDASIMDKEHLLILFEENGNVLYDDGRTGPIWGIAKEIAAKNGITLLKKGDKVDDVELEADETGGSPTYVKRVFPYLVAYENEQNRFGKDKMTFTFRNCTYGNNIPLDNTIIGETGKVRVLRQSGRASFNAWDPKWPAGEDMFLPWNSDSYPTFIFE